MSDERRGAFPEFLPEVDGRVRDLIARSPRRGRPGESIPADRPDDGKTRAVYKQAIDRYTSDHARFAEAMERRKAMKYRQRRDVSWLRKWGHRVLTGYDMATSFVAVHAGLWVRRHVRERRRDYCRACSFRYRREAPNIDKMPVPAGTPLTVLDRCHGYAQGEKCNCPDDPIWRPGSLLHRTRLRFFRCPIGNWDRGSHVPALPLSIRRLFRGRKKTDSVVDKP